MYGFCSRSFCSILGISKRLRLDLCREETSKYLDHSFRENRLGVQFSPDDYYPEDAEYEVKISNELLNEIKEILARKSIILDRESMSLFIAPNTSQVFKLRAWLTQFFKLVGDNVPNLFDTIHIDCMPKKRIHDEYVDTMILFFGDHEETVSYSYFLKLWKKLYPNVKTRESKNVCGHCSQCSNLGYCRRTTGDNFARGQLTLLHAYHRHFYMGEKSSYYLRQLQALMHPNKYMSVITDGMNQRNSQIPNLGNKNEFGKESIVQHLQIILEHGQGIVIYRTFAHVIKNDRNTCIHALLLQLEERLAKFGTLADILCVQLDGGGENANDTFLALLALIVSRRLGRRNNQGGIKKIFYTRLPVGHTHEDGDAVFGNIRKATKEEYILTPEDYKQRIEHTQGISGLKIKVTDIFVTPDYEELLKEAIDPNLKNLWKKEEARLQWIFERVDFSPEYPFGVKCSYRSFVMDESFEVVPVDKRVTPGYSLPYRVRRTINRTFPLPTEEPIHIFKQPFHGPIIPKAILKNSANSTNKTMRRVATYFSQQSHVVEEWQKFRETKMPNDDYVQNYIKENASWHIPFHEELFGELPVDFNVVIEPTVRNSRKDKSEEQINKKKNSQDKLIKKYVKNTYDGVPIDKEFYDEKPIPIYLTTSSVLHSGNLHRDLPPIRELVSDPAAAKSPAEMKQNLYKVIDDLTLHNSTRKSLLGLLKDADPKLSKEGNKQDLIDRLIFVLIDLSISTI